MGMTKATGGPVRCPWCARPVSDGPGSPEACPSCGVPLSPGLLDTSQLATTAATRAGGAARARKSQRLRAFATMLALTAVMLLLAAIGVAAAVLRGNGSDSLAVTNLQSVLRAAEEIRLNTTFTDATPATLMAKVPGVTVVGSTVPSADPTEISMIVADVGSGEYGWYGAVRSKSGHCFAAASVNGDPRVLTAVLPGNCTGDAARAALMPIAPDTPTMSSTDPAAAAVTAGAGAGSGASASGPTAGSGAVSPGNPTG